MGLHSVYRNDFPADNTRPTCLNAGRVVQHDTPIDVRRGDTTISYALHYLHKRSRPRVIGMFGKHGFALNHYPVFEV